jgi:hypothetical protein
MLATYNRLRCHIRDSDMEVIRKARTRLSRTAKRSREFRKGRHAFYREMLALHKQARAVADKFRF